MMRAATKDTTLTYTKIVERYALFFDRPEVRLRFLNKTLARQTEREKELQQSLRRFTFIGHTRLYRWLMELGLYRLIFEEIQGFLPSIPVERRPLLSQLQVPLSAKIFFQLYRVRYLFYGAGIGLAAAGLFGLYLLAMWSARNVNDYIARQYRTPNPAAQNSGGVGIVKAEGLPGYDPGKIWRIDKPEEKDGEERYSNSAKILTEYEVENHQRMYYLLKRGAEVPEAKVHNEIVGIVYHTSENEMVDFKPDNNDSIQQRTHSLLSYVQQKRAYNYLIDRFGQIYRIVRDDQAAHHAGHSIWANKDDIYVGLNEAFIGVAFESSTAEAESANEQLTPAQIYSGRLLTEVLRSRYKIDDANCVTHGLVSISPENMQIGFHYDGAKNFPFEALGLSDKYKVPPASVSLFGCTWDDKILEKLGGELWPGVKLAEDEFTSRAAETRADVKELRKRKRELYREQIELGRRLREKNQV